MDIFKQTTLTWWQIGLLKWAVLLIGIAIGATWSEFFVQYALVCFVVGLFFSAYVGYVWFRQR